MELFPAFNYAQDEHTTDILLADHEPGCLESKTVTFASKNLRLQLDVTIDRGEEDAASCPTVRFRKEKKPGMLGSGKLFRIFKSSWAICLQPNLPLCIIRYTNDANLA